MTSLEAFHLDRLVSSRAQPPEIVSKSTTTSIFGNREESEEPPLDLVPAGQSRQTRFFSLIRW